jgi:cytoplasmic tRNA 2-thiolation protein 1
MPTRCTRCKVELSTYHRPYSGERLCPNCFKSTIIERVKKTINKYKMFEWDSRIAIGVSGGKDSLVLLNILHEIESNRPNAELIAICIDEGIAGYRDEALRLAKKNCNKLGIEIKVKSFKELFDVTMDEIAIRERELATCSYCGVLRRRALNEAAKQVNADILATGHNLDDMAQSVLLNLLRGDINRINSFNPGGQQLGDFIRKVKPLCEVPERETTYYSFINNIEFQSLPCPYADEAMRSDARKFLNQMEYKRPGTKFIVYKTGLKIKKYKVSKILNYCEICGTPTPGKICRVCELTTSKF